MNSQTLTGDCGSSTITAVANGNRDASIGTGFVIDLPAVQYEWQVNISDSKGESYRYWSGPLGLRHTWAGGADFQSGTGGLTTFSVDTSISYALTSIGTLCYSEGPSVSDIVY